MLGNNGKGEVILNKNIKILNDILGYGDGSMQACQWARLVVVATKDSSDLIYKILLTPNGISNITSQNLGVLPAYVNQGQIQFSPDGKKFASSFTIYNPGPWYHDLRIFDFDRCSGVFSLDSLLDLQMVIHGSGHSVFIKF